MSYSFVFQSRGVLTRGTLLLARRKAVNDLYRETIEQLQAVEARLDAEKAAAQQAAQALVTAAEKDGCALVAQAEADLRQADRDAIRAVEAQAASLRQQMLADTEHACGDLRQSAMARMDKAVAYLVEKVVRQ